MKEITLPLQEAITLSAKENWERDKRVDLIKGEYTPKVKKEYEEEARAVFEHYDGVGYDPDYPDHHLIKVKK